MIYQYRPAITKSAVMFLVASQMACFAGWLKVAKLEDKNFYPPRTSPEKILVFALKPDTTYVEFARIYGGGLAGTSNKKGAIKKLRKKASEIGGDAIILDGFEEGEAYMGTTDPETGEQVASEVIDVSATVIRFVP